MAHIRQSRPDSGLGFEAKIVATLQGVVISLGSGGGGCARYVEHENRVDQGLHSKKNGNLVHNTE